MIKVDTHFHTNFFFPSKYLIKKRAKAIWRQWEKFALDMVILTEHSFKNPQKSYLKLMENKPSEARTHVVPGVECVTREGIDVIVFSRDEHIYAQSEMIKTYGLHLDDLLERVDADDKLYAVVTHPFAPTHSAVSCHREEGFLMEMIERTGILEKHNAALIPLKKAFRFLALHRVFPAFADRIERMDNVPDEFVREETLVFGGSDAHRPCDIGSHLQIDVEVEERGYHQVFDAMLALEGERNFVHHRRSPFSVPFSLIWGTLITGGEAFKKRLMLFKLK